MLSSPSIRSFKKSGLWLLLTPMLILAWIRIWGIVYPPTIFPSRILVAHVGNEIKSICFASDSKTLAVGGGHWGTNSGEVVLWNVQTGTKDGTFKTYDVSSIALSPDGGILSSGTETWLYGNTTKNGKVSLWNIKTGKLLRSWTTIGHPIISLYFMNGSKLISGGRDGSIKIWDAARGKFIRTLSKSKYPFSAVAVCPGNHLVSTASGTKITIWEIKQGVALQTLSGHTDKVTSITFSPHRRIISGSFDKTVRVWDVDTGRIIHTLFVAQSTIVTSVAISPDGRTIASGHLGRAIRLWDTRTGSLLCTLDSGKRGGRVKALTFSPDGKFLASSEGINVKLWNIDQLKISY